MKKLLYSVIFIFLLAGCSTTWNLAKTPQGSVIINRPLELVCPAMLLANDVNLFLDYGTISQNYFLQTFSDHPAGPHDCYPSSYQEYIKNPDYWKNIKSNNLYCSSQDYFKDIIPAGTRLEIKSITKTDDYLSGIWIKVNGMVDYLLVQGKIIPLKWIIKVSKSQDFLGLDDTCVKMLDQ